jgi:hypothetical protein
MEIIKKGSYDPTLIGECTCCSGIVGADAHECIEAIYPVAPGLYIKCPFCNTLIHMEDRATSKILLPSIEEWGQ